jgi:hypothetical protein
MEAPAFLCFRVDQPSGGWDGKVRVSLAFYPEPIVPIVDAI